MLGLFTRKREAIVPPVVTDQTPPHEARSIAELERLVSRQANQIIHLRAALREIERLPFRSRRAQEIAQRARMARPGDYFKAAARTETEGV